jgi:hypothetical protein
MSFRLLVTFLFGAAFFTVLPIYAPFIVLQSEEMPRFLSRAGQTIGVLFGGNDRGEASPTREQRAK